MSIITASQVLKHSPSARNLKSRPKPVCDVIPQVEEAKMIEMVGWENYQNMLEDLIDFSAVAKWNDEASYVAGNQVVYDDIVYEATVNINNNNAPTDCNQWHEVEIFESDCYNLIWYTGGLRKIIAWYVYANAAPFYPQILDVAGFSDSDDPDMQKKINFHLSSTYKQITMMRQTFVRWHSKYGDCMSLSACSVYTDTDANRTDRKDNL